MPELPEVESVRRGLADVVTGRRVERIAVLHARPVRQHKAGPDDFAARLVGEQFAEPRRRGKFLWLPLVDGDAILAHLGMSGQFRVDHPEADLQRHARILMDLDDGRQLRFVDQRMFGGLSLSEGGAELPREVAHIARDPFDPLFDRDDAVRRLRAKRSGVKRVLLDQTWVSGVGNIYADESLWRARLHGEQPASSLSVRKANELLRHVHDVMAEAIEQGGTSFDALYVHVNGESGYFSRALRAYGRTDEPCDRCGTPIVREPFMNRSSFRCPRCQRLR